MADEQTGDVLTGQRGELRATIEIKRAATGKIEYYDLVGYADADDLQALLSEQPGGIQIADATAGLARSVDATDLIDQAAVVDQAAVTSTVTVDGRITVRTYSDGTIQENVWPTDEAAQAFADSVNAVEGGN